jgi:hypothetical protein
MLIGENKMKRTTYTVYVSIVESKAAFSSPDNSDMLNCDRIRVVYTGLLKKDAHKKAMEIRRGIITV